LVGVRADARFEVLDDASQGDEHARPERRIVDLRRVHLREVEMLEELAVDLAPQVGARLVLVVGQRDRSGRRGRRARRPELSRGIARPKTQAIGAHANRRVERHLDRLVAKSVVPAMVPFVDKSSTTTPAVPRRTSACWRETISLSRWMVDSALRPTENGPIPRSIITL